MKIDIFDYVNDNPLFINLDILGPYSDLAENLDDKCDNCVYDYSYDEKPLNSMLEKLGVPCDIVMHEGDLLGLMFKTEQDKLAFILKVS